MDDERAVSNMMEHSKEDAELYWDFFSQLLAEAIVRPAHRMQSTPKYAELMELDHIGDSTYTLRFIHDKIHKDRVPSGSARIRS